MYIPQKGVAKVIKTLREKRNMSQRELAAKIGKHQSYIGRIETTSGENIKIHTLVEIFEKGLDARLKIELK